MRSFSLLAALATASAVVHTKDEGYQYYKVQVDSVITGSAPLISELKLLGGATGTKLTPVDIQCSTGNNEYCHGAITGGMAWNKNCREAGFELGYGGQNTLKVKLAKAQAVTDVQIWTSHIGACRGANFQLLGSADGAQWTSIKSFPVETCSCGDPINVHIVDFQHCKVNWGEYGNCLKSCGVTTKERTGTVHTAPTGGGDACPTLKQSAACKTHVCPCPSGHFHNPMDCSACPKGRFQSEMGRNYCEPCRYGTYNDETGQTACKVCAIGTASAVSASTVECAQCGLGRYQSEKGEAHCIFCPAGKFQPYYGKYDHSHCETCDKGTFALAGAGSCTACAMGQFGPTEGARNCNLCKAGTFNKHAGKDHFSDCKPCPVGRYGAKGSATCTQCPAGRFNEYSGGKTLASCVACASGTASSSGAYACDKCAPGKYQHHNGENYCQDCPCGTFNPSEGASSASVCTTCNAGTYSSAGAYVCTKCAAGFAATKRGNQCNSSSCQICKAGTFAFAGATKCKACMEGHYSAADGTAACIMCPVARYNAHQGAKDAAGCKACRPGTYQLEPGQDKCYNCGAGSWAAKGAERCTKCDKGRFSAAENAETSSTCVLCVAGHFADKTGSTACTACARGTYIKVGGATSEGNCLKCAGDKYNTKAGSSRCIPCQKRNRMWGTKAAAMSKKKIEEFLPSSCISCPPGRFQKFDGSKICAECASGQFKSGDDHRSCTKVTDGWFTQNMAGQTQQWEKPRNCVTGEFSSWGTCSKVCSTDGTPGTQTRTRVEKTPGWTNPLLPNIPGVMCTKDDLTETRDCDGTNGSPATTRCPVDCKTYAFGSWTPCSKKCGGGTTERTAGIRIEANYGGKACEPHQLKETAQCNVHKCLSAGKCDAKHVTCSVRDKLSHNRGKYGKAFEDSGEDYESFTMKVEHYKRNTDNDWGLAMTADRRATAKDSLTGTGFRCHRTSTALNGPHTCACFCKAHPDCGCQKEGWGIKGTPLVGNVYTNTADAQGCCNLCTNHPLCMGWEFVGQQCSLKAGGEMEQVSGSQIAGLRSGQVC